MIGRLIGVPNVMLRKPAFCSCVWVLRIKISILNKSKEKAGNINITRAEMFTRTAQQAAHGETRTDR